MYAYHCHQNILHGVMYTGQLEALAQYWILSGPFLPSLAADEPSRQDFNRMNIVKKV